MAEFGLPEVAILRSIGAKILLSAMDEVRATRADMLVRGAERIIQKRKRENIL